METQCILPEITHKYVENCNAIVELNFHFQVYIIILIKSPMGFHTRHCLLLYAIWYTRRDIRLRVTY